MPDNQVAAILARIRSGQAITGLTIQRDAPPDALRWPREENRGAAFRERGMHAMRHHFASLLLNRGREPEGGRRVGGTH